MEIEMADQEDGKRTFLSIVHTKYARAYEVLSRRWLYNCETFLSSNESCN